GAPRSSSAISRRWRGWPPAAARPRWAAWRRGPSWRCCRCWRGSAPPFPGGCARTAGGPPPGASEPAAARAGRARGRAREIRTRRLSDVPRSLPDVVAVALSLDGAPFVLDGEVVALDPAGRPLPFQELMRRFRRVHGVEALVREMPLALYFFDCLIAEGRSLIDAPYAERWAALERVTGGRYLAERAIVEDEDAAQAFHARSLAAGHEGVMAKDLKAPYEPGGRGKRWFKLQVAETVDCVIIAADRGSGRRVGWLSNYHLAVRDGERLADVGKTFKGLTDAEFAAMTARLKALAVEDDGYTVRVRPEVVGEVEYNEIQRSPTYPSGFALRFARIPRIREDQAHDQAPP